MRFELALVGVTRFDGRQRFFLARLGIGELGFDDRAQARIAREQKRLGAIYAARRAWIELDYCVLIARSNPAEARKIFAEVKERFTKSTAAGDLLVISGLAVNEYEYPVGRIKLRGKILDNTGKLLGEVETYAGNLLNDEELNRLSDKEILAELQRPEGSDMPNTGIRSRTSIPFMIVFMNPPKEVDEFIIELAGVERAPAASN